MARALFFGLFSSISFLTSAQGADANMRLKEFFIKLDDQHNRAMEQKDSAALDYLFAAQYINCTPNGEINDKAAEIKTLIHGPWKSVERVAPKYDIFAFSGKVASLTLTKKVRIDTPVGEKVLYVRRTTVYKQIDKRWQAISGQGTMIMPKLLGF
ncbi:nuclear transport factor 2 family protein [Dyadobacter sp. CY107]|uniref:nuclear transport factor 2 family protein n=1 Tax=Dyadobacter fanqingshengii TaxID=2906443 RepID=UPI001F289F6E|nr:nuclear transport factor 2 family protein [Dyadobacter fanqingshengii]MCF2502031.1 nuclear transport factor 2 family protein [Dyadobacter fanqingshengii]